MAEISVEYGATGTKRLRDLQYGEQAIILEGPYKGGLVWKRKFASDFQALLPEKDGIIPDGFTNTCPVMVRVLQEGDEVKLKF